MTTCRICDHDVKEVFNAQVLKKHPVQYYHCRECGFIQSEEPYWLQEAYGSPINASDTGIIARNIALSEKVAVILYFLFQRDAQFLDAAGGYGIFTRIMRDIGFDFYWHDPYAQNILARGFEVQNTSGMFELVTAFEVFEHFIDPRTEISRFLSHSDSLLFSTQLLPTPIPQPDSWWYYGFDHGQHISFYSQRTLAWIAREYQLKVYSHNGLHLLSRRTINPLRFKLYALGRRWGLYNFVRMRMKSKTTRDMFTRRDYGRGS